MKLDDMPREAWKALATVGIWMGVGVCAAFGCTDMKELVSTAGLVTITMWIFG